MAVIEIFLRQKFLLIFRAILFQRILARFILNFKSRTPFKKLFHDLPAARKESGSRGAYLHLKLCPAGAPPSRTTDHGPRFPEMAPVVSCP